MDYTQYLQTIAGGFEFDIDASLTINKFLEFCAVDNKVALKVSAASKKYKSESQVIINKENGTTSIGELIICKSSHYTGSSASAALVAAYLSDVETIDVVQQGPYTFQHNYVVIDIAYYTEYINSYRPGSSIWGHFTHVEEQTQELEHFKKEFLSITAFPEIKINRDFEKDLIFRAISHTSALERTLKLYHLLELYFDAKVVDEIKALNNDLNGIGKVLKKLSQQEFDKLLRVCRSASDDINFFLSILDKIFSIPAYHTQLVEMLFEHDKDSNPYSKVEPQLISNLCSDKFSIAAVKNAKLTANYDHYSKFVAYIIYRFRCSIAHAKIGEYVLTNQDEQFICEIAEPAITRILCEIYKN